MAQLRYIKDKELIEEVFQGLLRMVYKSKHFTHEEIIYKTSILGNVDEDAVEDVLTYISDLINGRALER